MHRAIRTFLKFHFIASLFSTATKECAAKVSAFMTETGCEDDT